VDVRLEVKQYGHLKVVLKSYGPNMINNLNQKILKAEYIWLDGYDVQNIRSKVKYIKDMDSSVVMVEDLPQWNFDGSSTKQADGNSSDCVLKPVRIIPNGYDNSHLLVLCEVYNSDGTVHPSNTRAKLRALKAEYTGLEYWWGFEQEYFIFKDGKPLGWPAKGTPPPQGENYCASGNKNVAGRLICEEHAEQCIASGMEITGVNAEVTLGQWEYQLFGKDTLEVCDNLILSRFLLAREAEGSGMDIELHPKPVMGDWNGSGCHINFSTRMTRDKGSKSYFQAICERLEAHHDTHMKVYGLYNDQRLTGNHETQDITKFSYGVSDRGASIRIPENVGKSWKGYLEDRRPSSNVDPYLATAAIVNTLR
jgi:glutamine synthetase